MKTIVRRSLNKKYGTMCKLASQKMEICANSIHKHWINRQKTIQKLYTSFITATLLTITRANWNYCLGILRTIRCVCNCDFKLHVSLCISQFVGGSFNNFNIFSEVKHATAWCNYCSFILIHLHTCTYWQQVKIMQNLVSNAFEFLFHY